MRRPRHLPENYTWCGEVEIDGHEIGVEVDVVHEDTSFDHEFGIEYCFDYNFFNLQVTSLMGRDDKRWFKVFDKIAGKYEDELIELVYNKIK